VEKTADNTKDEKTTDENRTI